MDSFPLLVASLVLVALALLVPLLTCNRRADVERELKPLWEEKCSGKIGAIGTNLPGIRLALYDTFIVVGFLGPTVIRYSSIQSVSVSRKVSFIGASSVFIKLRNMLSGYHFNSRDPKAVAKLIEARL